MNMVGDIIALCNIRGATDDDDKLMFRASDIVEHPQDGILQIKHNDPKSKILILRATDDNIDSKQWVRLCCILRQNYTVDHLSISGRRGRPTPVFWICAGIQMNQTIRDLSMYDVALGGSCQLNLLSDFFAENPRLEKLTLNRCHLERKDIDCLSDKLMFSDTLKELDLSGNNFGDHSLDSLVSALIKMKSVKRLKLGSNDIGERGAMSLAYLLRSQACTIEELDISSNSIRVEAASYLVNSLRRNKRLRRLDLNDNLMNDMEWRSVMGGILQLVHDTSSVYNTIHSNHTLSSLGTNRGNPSQVTRRRRIRRYPMEAMFQRYLGVEHAQYLHASFCLNYRAESDSFKVRHKILWSHVREDFNLGEDPTILSGAIPRIIGFIGKDSNCESCHRASANLILYQDQTPPHQVLNTIRLGAIYRILQARPELCTQFDELHHCQQELAHANSTVETLLQENERLREQLSCCDSIVAMTVQSFEGSESIQVPSESPRALVQKPDSFAKIMDIHSRSALKHISQFDITSQAGTKATCPLSQSSFYTDPNDCDGSKFGGSMASEMTPEFLKSQVIAGRPHTNVDALFNEISELLVTNATLFYRCIGSMEGVCAESDKTSFSRYDYDSIKVLTGPKSTQLVTGACTSKLFDLKFLYDLPPILDGLVEVQYKSHPYSRFISYEKIIETVREFQDKALLEMCLSRLKVHLEDVHLCLFKVDVWLRESDVDNHFIESTFGIKLEKPALTTCLCIEGSHSRSCICHACQCPLASHKDVKDSHIGLIKKSCPKSNGFFNCKDVVLRTFKHCDESLLYENGFLKRTFYIKDVQDQHELAGFVHFLSNADHRMRKVKSSDESVAPVRAGPTTASARRSKKGGSSKKKFFLSRWISKTR